MRFVLHTFRASETIDAVIRLMGRHNYTSDEMVSMRLAFDQLNGKIVPRPGMQYKIPLPLETVDEFGSVVSTISVLTETAAVEDTAQASPGVAGSNEPAKVIDSVQLSSEAPDVIQQPVSLSDAEAKLAEAQAKLAALRAARLSRNR